MLTDDLLAFVRASLPAPPARVLEIGAGAGALAATLRGLGHEVTAIDPRDEPADGVVPVQLIEAQGRFDAALAVVSLHHVEPLGESIEHLAGLLEPGALLVIDEIDCERYDTRAAEWWLGQRRALGLDAPVHTDHGDHPMTAAEIVEGLRAHIHPAAQITQALARHFDLGAPARGPYLHRWELDPELYATEVELIARGEIPAVGWRQVAVRR